MPLRAPLAVDVPELLELAVAVEKREGAAAAGTDPALLPPDNEPVLRPASVRPPPFAEAAAAPATLAAAAEECKRVLLVVL